MRNPWPIWRKTYEDRKRVVYRLSLDCWPDLVAHVEGLRLLKGKRPRAHFWKKRVWIRRRWPTPKGSRRIRVRRPSYARLRPASIAWTFGLEIGERQDGPCGYCRDIARSEAMCLLEEWMLANAPSRHAKAAMLKLTSLAAGDDFAGWRQSMG
jgi:hypothetical protein